MPDTPDWEKFTTIMQYAASAGVFVGGVVAAIVATTRSKAKPPATTDSDDRTRLQRQIDESILRKDLEEILSASRRSFYDLTEKNHRELSDKLDEIRDEQHKMDIRLVRVEERRRPIRDN